MKRAKTTMEVVCLQCHQDMDDRTGIRSLTWYGGLAGTRAVLCSPECRDAWDNENLSQVADMIHAEEDA